MVMKLDFGDLSDHTIPTIKTLKTRHGLTIDITMLIICANICFALLTSATTGGGTGQSFCGPVGR